MFQKLYTRYAERVKPLPRHRVEVQLMGLESIDILYAFDISMKGVGVRLPIDHSLCSGGEKVELIITLPGGRPFKAGGFIRHVTERPNKPHCFGVEFVSIANKNLSQIRHYMEETKLVRTKLAC